MADAEIPPPFVRRWGRLFRQLIHILGVRKIFHNAGEYLKQFAALKAPKKRKPVRWQAPPRDRSIAASAAAIPKAKARPRNLPSSSSSYHVRVVDIEEWIPVDPEPDPESSAQSR